MLTRVAERELQRKQTKMARAISDAVIKKNPQNAKARAVKGYAALKDKNLPEAEKVFREMSGKGTSAPDQGTENVDVKVKDSLSAFGASVDDRAITISDS